MTDFDQQLEKMRTGRGFVAALDQSGGSTPKALLDYGIDESAYANEQEMFDLVHAMRARIVTSPAFAGERILGAILFEQTMDRQIEGRPTAEYLWKQKSIVPFLKIDRGMGEKSQGVQLMKDMPDLDTLLKRAKQAGIFGTKMRSVIHHANAAGIQTVVSQQFEYARRIFAAGLIPIVEPEISIKSPEKAEAEALLRQSLLDHLERLDGEEKVIFKLTLPEKPGFYEPCQRHARVVRVLALSGGYSRDEANDRLAKNKGMVASFSRALVEGVSANQSDKEFAATLGRSIESIYQASVT